MEMVKPGPSIHRWQMVITTGDRPVRSAGNVLTGLRTVQIASDVDRPSGIGCGHIGQHHRGQDGHPDTDFHVDLTVELVALVYLSVPTGSRPEFTDLITFMLVPSARCR